MQGKEMGNAASCNKLSSVLLWTFLCDPHWRIKLQHRTAKVGKTEGSLQNECADLSRLEGIPTRWRSIIYRAWSCATDLDFWHPRNIMLQTEYNSTTPYEKYSISRHSLPKLIHSHLFIKYITESRSVPENLQYLISRGHIQRSKVLQK